jgi:hypothetical protein
MRRGGFENLDTRSHDGLVRARAPLRRRVAEEIGCGAEMVVRISGTWRDQMIRG